MTIFSPDQLAVIVKQTLPTTLPVGHSNAIVATVDQTGAQVVVGFHRDLGTGLWEAQGAYRHTWATGDNQVGARFIYSWP